MILALFYTDGYYFFINGVNRIIFFIFLLDFVENRGKLMSFDTINTISYIRKDLFTSKYKKDVADFMLNYLILEAYWKDSDNLGTIDNFCKKYALYFWKQDKIQKYAKKFSSVECVGSSNISRFGREPSDEIVQVTKFLREQLRINYSGAYSYKMQKNLIGEQWRSRKDQCGDANYASFRALMYIIRQIRNNLFHGNKFDLEEEQKKRNEFLVKTGSKTIEFVLNNLYDAERKIESKNDSI